MKFVVDLEGGNSKLPFLACSLTGDEGITSFSVLDPKNETFTFMLLLLSVLGFLWIEEQEPITQKDDSFMIIKSQSGFKERKVKNGQKGVWVFGFMQKGVWKNGLVRKKRNWRENEKRGLVLKGKFMICYCVVSRKFVVLWWVLDDATYILLLGKDYKF